jgi:hypothetical protein
MQFMATVCCSMRHLCKGSFKNYMDKKKGVDSTGGVSGMSTVGHVTEGK